MIRLDRVTVTYPDAATPVLREVSLAVPEGELCLVVGSTGAGKSTLLGLVNGLVPHFTGGTVAGEVRVAGRSTATHRPRDLADVVGYIGQDPAAGFVSDTVEEELAYGMEQLGLPPDVMRRRVEETLDLLGLAGLRSRSVYALSGGQQQRVAIGSALTAHPRVLVLDEPTSALDPTSAEDVLAAITRLVHDLGITVLLAEHRLERVVQYADRVAYLPGDGALHDGPPPVLFADIPLAPPVIEIGRLAGWSPLPMSVRDARRLAEPLRARATQRPLPPARVGCQRVPGVLGARGVRVRHGDVVAVRDVDLDLAGGEVVALMGRNGAGKSSLLWALQGSGPRQGGSVLVAGIDPGTAGATRSRTLVGLVPQTPADLLYLDTVRAELAQADRESGPGPTTARALLDRIARGIEDDTHPRDLSEGQRLCLVIAIQLRAAPRVMLLDEPTRGLDYAAKAHLIGVLDELAAAGHAVVVATHDVEFVASAADRVLVLADGEVVADGPTADVVVASPAFAPQTAKVLAPVPVLTVSQLAAVIT